MHANRWTLNAAVGMAVAGLCLGLVNEPAQSDCCRRQASKPCCGCPCCVAARQGADSCCRKHKSCCADKRAGGACLTCSCGSQPAEPRAPDSPSRPLRVQWLAWFGATGLIAGAAAVSSGALLPDVDPAQFSAGPSLQARLGRWRI